MEAETQKRICDLIRAGNQVSVAVAAVGVTDEAFAAAVEDVPEFGAAVDLARAEAESILVTRVAKAASGGSWQAAAWLLERAAPERWGKAVDRRMAAAEQADAPRSEFDDLDGDEGGNVHPIRKSA
jgi:hypothetical protein